MVTIAVTAEEHRKIRVKVRSFLKRVSADPFSLTARELQDEIIGVLARRLEK